MIASRFKAGLFGLALCSVSVPAPVGAQVHDGARAQAIEIGESAIELYDAGRYRLALERFRAAERVAHSPVFALYEARCLEKLGRLTEAQRAYQRLGAEQLPPEASPAWRAAQSDAGVELRALMPRVPSVRVTIFGATSPALELDGAPLQLDGDGAEVFLDPGVHEIAARDERGRMARARFELREGQRGQTVQVRFAPERGALAAPSSAPSPARAALTGMSRVRPELAKKPATDGLGIALLSAAGAGIVAGTVTGLLAALQLQDVRERCVGNVCRASDETKGRAVESLALASTIGFAAGGVCLGAWGLRVVLAPPGAAGSARSAAPMAHVSGVF